MNDDTVDVAQLNRATAVAQEYDALMGLSTVVLGAGFFMAAATGQPAVWIALGAAFSELSTGWYHRRFGFVRMRGGRAQREVAGVVVALVVILAALVVDRWLMPPVSLSLLAVAGVLAGGQLLMLRRLGVTPVHWAAYAAMVLAGIAPLVGVGGGGLLSPFGLTVTGAALVVVGLADHRRLIHLLGDAPDGQADERR